MLYIIMCGGNYKSWEIPRQLTVINGETILERTIRLLRENGVEDIAISSNHPAFESFGVPVLHHENSYTAVGAEIVGGYWFEAFYPTSEPTCYLFGDVVFSPEAIRAIVETETDDIEFFASAPPFADNYPKKWAEPFALKVVNTDHLKHAINCTRQFDEQGLFIRHPIMWELWQVIQAAPLNYIDYTSYMVINDYTCDIDRPWDIAFYENLIS